MQFSLAQLLGAAAIVAVYLGIFKYLGSSTLVPVLFMACCRPIWPTRQQDRYVFGAYVGCVHLACLACGSVWYTDGEVESFGRWMNCTAIGIVSLIACRAKAYRTAFLVVALLCAHLVYQQAGPVWNLRQLEAEVAEMGRYVEDYNRRNGAYRPTYTVTNHAVPNCNDT